MLCTTSDNFLLLSIMVYVLGISVFFPDKILWLFQEKYLEFFFIVSMLLIFVILKVKMLNFQ